MIDYDLATHNKIELIKEKVIELAKKDGINVEEKEISNLFNDEAIVLYNGQNKSLNMINIKIDSKDATSIKLGNIIINWKKIITLLPGLTTGVGDNHIKMIGFLIKAINFIYVSLSVKLDEKQINVIMALIEAGAHSSYKDEKYVKEVFGKLHNISLNNGDFENACTQLSELNCIDILDGKILLCEKYILR